MWRCVLSGDGWSLWRPRSEVVVYARKVVIWRSIASICGEGGMTIVCLEVEFVVPLPRRGLSLLVLSLLDKGVCTVSEDRVCWR